jgi:hypothetical protein
MKGIGNLSLERGGLFKRYLKAQAELRYGVALVFISVQYLGAITMPAGSSQNSLIAS